jgi:tetratricopeptide (TPR) repeat protein
MAVTGSRTAHVAMGLGAVVVLGAALLSGGPQARVALTPDTVVADLGGGQTYSPALRAVLQAQRATPADAETATTAARLMIAEGRANGDSRLVGAALAILQPFVEDDLPAAQYLAATARQYQHDFPGALALLDGVLAADPHDVNALLNRATIHTVLGDYPKALQDCTRIATLRPDVGFLCQATTLTLTTDAPAIATRLTAILARPGAIDPALTPWATSLLGEIALLQGNAVMAEKHLTEVLKDDPGAQREQLMLADLLLDQGRAAEVMTLLQTAPDTDGVLIRRVLALRAQGRDADDIVTILATRAQRSLDIGLVAHAREEAMFYLLIADDPAQALERSLVNWAQQHEFDDARLLILAADAAGKPDAALPVLAWMRNAGVNIPAFEIPESVAALPQP